MELFTLGIGHYSEGDVKEAARALTGWTVADGAFLEYAANHDPGEKTILGQSGKWAGSDLIRLLLEHPATARRLAGRLCETFMGEGSVRSQDRTSWRRVLRASPRYRLGRRDDPAIVPSSRRRTSARGSWDRSSSSSARCGRGLPARRPRDAALAGWATRMGQDLFYPPNVGGWAGGRSWLSSRGMIARMNFATALASGRELGLAEPHDVLPRWPGRPPLSLDRVVGSLAELLSAASRSLPGAIGSSRPQAGRPRSARRAVALILSSPEAQLA